MPYLVKKKIQAIRETLHSKNIAGHFISSLDDIVWILNARGQDVEYNPVFLSHLYVSAKQTVLFIDAEKVDVSIQQALAADGIEIRNYEDTAKFLANISDASVLLDPAKVSIFMNKPSQKIFGLYMTSTRVRFLNRVNMKAKLLISVMQWLKMESRFATFFSLVRKNASSW